MRERETERNIKRQRHRKGQRYFTRLGHMRVCLLTGCRVAGTHRESQHSGKQRQEQKFKASLSYTSRHCLQKKNKPSKNEKEGSVVKSVCCFSRG